MLEPSLSGSIIPILQMGKNLGNRQTNKPQSTSGLSKVLKVTKTGRQNHSVTLKSVVEESPWRPGGARVAQSCFMAVTETASNSKASNK